MSKSPTTWIEVDLSAIRHNVRQVRSLIGETPMLAVVKANAYGHGAVEVSRAVLEEGACSLGVTRVEDALELRDAGISAPVMIFDSPLPEHAPSIVELGLEVTVCTYELALRLSEEARAKGKTARVHIKIDTGMCRLGAPPSEAMELATKVSELPGIEIAGVYTHLATAADKNKRGAYHQLQVFDECLAQFKSAGLSWGSAHAAASAAVLCMPQSRYDMVRVGTLLYGQYPSSYVPRTLDLQETWKLKTRVAFIKDIPKGSRVGYGAEYVAPRRSRIAILPVGYADGLSVGPESVFRRNIALKSLRYGLSGWPPVEVTIHMKRVPVVGRIAMEMCAVDITEMPGIEIGDEVTLPCRRVSADSRIQRVYRSA